MSEKPDKPDWVRFREEHEWEEVPAPEAVRAARDESGRVRAEQMDRAISTMTYKERQAKLRELFRLEDAPLRTTCAIPTARWLCGRGGSMRSRRTRDTRTSRRRWATSSTSRPTTPPTG